MINRETLKEFLHYDDDTGEFAWIKSPANHIAVGEIAGRENPEGYRIISLKGRKYMAHRLAWLYMAGRWPKDKIDHRNGVTGDNRWSNLREATDGENQQNRPKNRNNTSGLTGAYWEKRASRWLAQIRVNKKQIYLGYFDDAESAHAAYLAAKARLHTFNPTVRSS